MSTYHKINGIYKRWHADKTRIGDPLYCPEKLGQFDIGNFSTPEFEMLKDIEWEWTEKIDGTNIRIEWELGWANEEGRKKSLIYDSKSSKLEIKGRTEKSQIPKGLLEYLQKTFTVEKMQEAFPDTSIILYGEGVGKKIQGKMGEAYSNYLNEDYGFILFDVKIGHWWLKRKDVEEVANKLNLPIAFVVGYGNIYKAIQCIREGLYSKFNDFSAMFNNDFDINSDEYFFAEGLVIRPVQELKDRAGNRIITKIKRRDFVKENENIT